MHEAVKIRAFYTVVFVIIALSLVMILKGGCNTHVRDTDDEPPGWELIH